nr:MAG TPA: hypothetical protein [Caudoviricetes sp.]
MIKPNKYDKIKDLFSRDNHLKCAIIYTKYV